jgi:predicted permease
MFLRKRAPSDFSGEIEAHLELETERLKQEGMAEEEARFAARRSFGNVTLAQERFYESGRWIWLDHLRRDIRYGARVLIKNPSFAAVAVVTLALGIGAITTIFSALNSTLLRPFPFRDPDRLLMVWGIGPKSDGFVHSSIPDYLEWRSQNSVFATLAGYGEAQPVSVEALDQHFRVRAVAASANLLATLGVRPALGASVVGDDASDRDAMISFRLWQDRFGSRLDIIGQQLETDSGQLRVGPIASGQVGARSSRQAFRIAAVLPSDFPLPFSESQHYDLLFPLAAAGKAFTSRADRSLHLLGRLRPGVTFAQAQAEAARIAAGLARTYPQFDRDTGGRVGSIMESRAFLKTPLWILFGAVISVLLVACGNVASLLLARGLVRQKELAVRAALGASRRRVIRQLLAENLLLATAGGALGFLLAVWGASMLVALGSATIPQLAAVRLDWQAAAAFAAAVTVSSVFLFGLIPAFEASRLGVHDSLKEAAATATTGSRQARLRNLLVAIQVSLAMIVLCGAGLLLRSFYDLILTNPGVRLENLVTADLSKNAAPAAQIVFYNEVLRRVRAIRGVQTVAAASSLPLGNEAVAPMPSITAPGVNLASPPVAMTRMITPSYFKTMGIPMLEGRDFTPADSAGAPRVAIVNELVVRRLFPGGHAVGRELEILPGGIDGPFSVQPGLVRIVGVIGDVMHWYTGTNPHLDAEVYLPYAQSPMADMTLVVRSTAASSLLAHEIETKITALDRAALIDSVKSMEREFSDTIAPQRFYPLFLGAFAAASLFLAAAGIYGVIAHLVRQRSHEIGIRLVLGARPVQVVNLVLLQGLRPALAGGILGLAGALGLTRFLGTLLYGVRPTDPATFAGVILLLCVVALAASYLPARRATKIDPIAALRHE